VSDRELRTLIEDLQFQVKRADLRVAEARQEEATRHAELREEANRMRVDLAIARDKLRAMELEQHRLDRLVAQAEKAWATIEDSLPPDELRALRQAEGSPLRHVLPSTVRPKSKVSRAAFVLILAMFGAGVFLGLVLHPLIGWP
jgi:hypothetical protein